MLPAQASLKEALGKITFRDALLGVEGLRQTVGGRTFLPLPGMTREIAALQIVRQYGLNRVPSFDEEPREVLLKRMSPEDASTSDLLLQTPIHSVFGRDHCPVSFLLDIDAKHETADETKNCSTFEDRVLGLVLFACRKAFAKHQLTAKKVCVLTAAGEGSNQPFTSLHLHIDFQNTVFHDSTSIANFIKGALTNEIEAIANASSSSSSSSNNNNNSQQQQQSISKFARRVIRAIDAQPFGTVGGSLRLYGAPKTDGTRPCRLYHPVPGGAAASALLALSPTEGGPTMELMKFAKNNNKNNNTKEMENEGKSNEKILLKEIRFESDSDLITTPSEEVSGILSKFDVLKQERILAKMKNQHQQKNSSSFSNLLPELNEILIGLHGVPVVRRIELDALAMSLGTPDWLAPEPFRFVSFKTSYSSSPDSFAQGGGDKQTKNIQQQQNNGKMKTSPNNNDNSTTFDPRFPGAHIRANNASDYRDFPQIIQDDICRTFVNKNQFPYPNHERKHNPMTYCYLATKVVPLLPDCFAVPYKTWVSICLAVTDIAAYSKKMSEMRLQELRAKSAPSDAVKAEIAFLENEAIDPIVALEGAFLDFSRKSPSNFDASICKSLYRKMIIRKLRDVSGKNAVNSKTAHDAYRTLVNYFRKSPP